MEFDLMTRRKITQKFAPNLSDFLPKKLTRWAKYVI